MKGFNKFAFDPKALRVECDRLAAQLKKNQGIELEERNHLSPIFKSSPNLVSVIGSAFGGVSSPDLIAYEYWILDKLRCDFALCNSRRHTFSFIELEDAKQNSVFVHRKPDLHNGLMGRPPYYDWADRFEHGASQMIDWIRILEDERQTNNFRAHFGSHNSFEACFVLVIGRDEFLDDDQKERLAWRTKNLQVAGYKVNSITYDQLLEEAEFELSTYAAAAAAATGTGPENQPLPETKGDRSKDKH